MLPAVVKSDPTPPLPSTAEKQLFLHKKPECKILILVSTANYIPDATPTGLLPSLNQHKS